MKTLTDAKASERLGDWLARALKGEDIGIVHSETGEIVALRPVKVYSEDYAFVEYGLTEKELDRAYKKTTRQIKKARAEGKLKRIA